MTLPVIAAVLALCIGAIVLSSQQMLLQSSAAQLARQFARGESGASVQRDALGFSVEVSRSSRSGAECVTLRASPGRGVLAAIELRASACALSSVAL